MSISEVQDYWNQRPCNIMHSPVNIDEDPLLYSQQVTARKYFVEPHIPGFAQFDRWNGRRVLELGCGIGTGAIEFARAGAYVASLDISNVSLEIARVRASAEGVASRIWFRQGNMENPQLIRGDYDLVYSFGAIHHTPNPSLALRQAHALLAPAGEIRLMLYHRCSWKVFIILLRNWRQLLRRKTVDQVVAMESEAQSGCPVTWTFTRRSARALLESCGFRVESMEVAHIFPYRILDYINHVYVKRWLWRILPQRAFRFLEQRFGWHLLIVARKVL